MRVKSFLLLLAIWLGAVPTAAAELLSHRAVYGLSLDSSTQASHIAGASGDLKVDWRDVCDGWATVTELRIRLLYQDGLEARLGTSITAWEAKNGLTYRFFEKRRTTIGEGRNRSGTAELSGPDAPGLVSYDADTPPLALPPGTLFPTAHALAMLHLAESGGDMLVRPVFDGSEDEEIFEVSGLVTGSVPPLGPDGGPALLRGLPSWRVSLAYFGASDPTGLPEHESTLRLFANGVIDEQRFDFGSFVLRARLRSLEPYARPDC